MKALLFYRNLRSRWFTLLAAALLPAFLIGCMQAYGRFDRNAQVGDAFRSGTVPQTLNYFYAGSQTRPYAIMGIDPGYTVPSRLWIAFAPQPEQMQTLSANLFGKDQYDPHGYHILSSDGEIIGIWFSSLHFPIVKVDREKRTVEVQYKNPESFRYF